MFNFENVCATHPGIKSLYVSFCQLNRRDTFYPGLIEAIQNQILDVSNYFENHGDVQNYSQVKNITNRFQRNRQRLLLVRPDLCHVQKLSILLCNVRPIRKLFQIHQFGCQVVFESQSSCHNSSPSIPIDNSSSNEGQNGRIAWTPTSGIYS